MAFKGTAAKSSSGASMSKYDVEVEKRLTALEAQAHEKPSGSTAERVSIIEAVLRKIHQDTWDKLADKERAQRG